jgi:CheY-like chemotaxis protein
MIVDGSHSHKKGTSSLSRMVPRHNLLLRKSISFFGHPPKAGAQKKKEGKIGMTESILNGKRLLAVDDEPDVLESLEELVLADAPQCRIEKAGNYEDAIRLLETDSYDLVVLDIMGVRGFDLLETAVKRNFRVAMLTAHALTPEALKRSYDMKAYAFLPKEKLADIVPFLEDVLKYDYATGWKRLLQKLHGFFSDRFVSDWEKKTGLEWKEWSK